MKTVIFDLDGTLLNTLDDLHGSVVHALTEAGLPPIDKMDTRRYLGNGVRTLIDKCVAHVAPEASEEKKNEVFGIFKDYYVHHSMERTAPYDGVDQMLKACREQGYATAIVSNKLDEAVQDLYKRFFCQSGYLFRNQRRQRQGLFDGEGKSRLPRDGHNAGIGSGGRGMYAHRQYRGQPHLYGGEKDSQAADP